MGMLFRGHLFGCHDVVNLYRHPSFTSKAFVQVDSAMLPTPLNVHRLLITGILLAAKLMDDNYFNNAYYAKVSAQCIASLPLPPPASAARWNQCSPHMPAVSAGTTCTRSYDSL